MAAKRRIIDIAMSEDQLEELGMIARSHTEAACRVDRARILLAYRADPSLYASQGPMSALLAWVASGGGGISRDGMRWVGSRSGFLLPVRVLSKLFRRLFLTRLLELHAAGKLVFFGQTKGLEERRAFVHHVAPLRRKKWHVYAKAPFAGPEAVLAYLARYTHRVAISNRRLIAFDKGGVTFKYKDYRRSGAERQQIMTLHPHEFIRRFLLHVLPRGFHRIRHYGLLASGARKASIARIRELLAAAPPAEPAEPVEPSNPLQPCPCCGGHMRIIQAFGRWSQPRAPPRAFTSTGMVPS